MTDLPLLNLRAPLTVRHKDTGRVLLTALIFPVRARLRDTVQYEGDASLPKAFLAGIGYTSEEVQAFRA